MSKFQIGFIILTVLFCVIAVAVNVSLFPSDIVDSDPVLSAVSSCEESKDEYPININTATKEELMKLPEIGETRAKAIIEYRENHGGFFTKDEIKNVKGIGDAIYNGLKDLITV